MEGGQVANMPDEITGRFFAGLSAAQALVERFDVVGGQFSCDPPVAVVDLEDIANHGADCGSGRRDAGEQFLEIAGAVPCGPRWPAVLLPLIRHLD